MRPNRRLPDVQSRLAVAGSAAAQAQTASGLPPGSLSGVTAGLIFAAPMIMNSLVKAGLTIAIARGRAGWRAATPLLLSIAAGLAGAAALLVSG